MKTYESALTIESDIYFHLPKLLYYAERSFSVTEIGLGSTGNSVMAFIKGCSKVTSYDIKWYPEACRDAEKYAKSLGHKWEFKLENSLDIEIEPTDFLFIDGEHSYNVVKDELFKHHSKVNKYIGFHDVVSFASRNENPEYSKDSDIKGIVPAIFEFLVDNPQWKIDYYSPYNNGLLILRRDY